MHRGDYCRIVAGARGPVWLCLLLILTTCTTVQAFHADPDQAQAGISGVEAADVQREQAVVETEDPQVILAQAQAWQARGTPFPDALLKKAVEAALQPEASWAQISAAIMAFEVYQERPWVTQVMQPFVVYHAAHILLNVEVFARLHRAWTQRAVTMAAPQTPGFVLSALRTLAVIDPLWARQLAAAVASATPAVVWAHLDVLLAVDTQWAEGVVRQAATSSPYDAIRAVSSYSAAPWGRQFFADVVLREPSWVVNLLTADPPPPQHQAVKRALDEATHPALQILAQLVQSSHPAEVKERVAVFVEALAEQALSFEAAAQLSSEARTYFHTLVAIQLHDPTKRYAAIEGALGAETSILVEEMNNLFEQPAAVRFRALETLSAHELYVFLVYGEAEMFTSSYRGVFERLLIRMHQEGLTGEMLLNQVHYSKFRIFVKAAAVLNRLDRFLATMSSPVARWSLFTRCMSDIERAPDILAQAVTAADILAAPLDHASLRLLRDTLKHEYARAELERHRQAQRIYGLLSATLFQRQASVRTDPALRSIAEKYLSLLPDLTDIPLAGLFAHESSIQRYFFYDDEDGRQSFQSFIAQYTHDKAWHIEDHSTFVHLLSTTPARKIEIYANKPIEDEPGLNDLDDLLRQRRVTPSVLVHRGHSIYVARSIAKLPVGAALVYLGNCGSYALLDTVLSKAPEAHIITTKGIGSITINDPLLKALNDYILRGENMTWRGFWRHAEATLGRNPRFVDYVAPDQNAGVVFLRAYRRVT